MELTLAVVQMSADPKDRRRNKRAAEGFVRDAAGRGAKLVVLPELFGSGYSYRLEARAAREQLDGPTFDWIRNLASELEIWLCGCVYEDAASACFNTFLLAGPEGEEFSHRKRTPATFESAFVAFEKFASRVGALLYEDWKRRGFK